MNFRRRKPPEIILRRVWSPVEITDALYWGCVGILGGIALIVALEALAWASIIP